MDAPIAITELRPGPRGTRRRRIYLADDAFRTTSVDVVRELDLQVGALVGPDELLERIAAVEPAFARDRALTLLSARDRSCSRLEARLRDDGYPEGVAAAAVVRLADLGLLDDARLADSLARTFAETELRGRRGVERELARRGIPANVASDVATRYCPAELEESRALDLAVRLVRSSDDERRLATRLIRRGYAPDIARRAATSVIA